MRTPSLESYSTSWTGTSSFYVSTWSKRLTVLSWHADVAAWRLPWRSAQGSSHGHVKRWKKITTPSSFTPSYYLLAEGCRTPRRRAMAGLQRSVTTFRRSGSSGVVWDERFFSGDLSRMRKEEAAAEFSELRHSKSMASSIRRTTARSGSTGGRHAFRASFVSPGIDPPSPRFICCGFLGTSRSAQRPKPRRR